MAPTAPTRSLRNELLGQDSLNEADASALVEEVLQDTDLAKFFDEEFEVSTWSYLHIFSVTYVSGTCFFEFFASYATVNE